MRSRARGRAGPRLVCGARPCADAHGADSGRRGRRQHPVPLRRATEPGLLLPEQGAAHARDAEIPVFTVALGTNDASGGGPFGGFNRTPDRATLRAIAQTTGGRYFAARSARALSSAYGDLGSRLGRVERRSEVTVLFVAAAALAVAAAVGLSRIGEPALP